MILCVGIKTEVHYRTVYCEFSPIIVQYHSICFDPVHVIDVCWMRSVPSDLCSVGFKVYDPNVCRRSSGNCRGD